MSYFDLSAIKAEHRPFVDWALSHVEHVDWRFPHPVPIEVKPAHALNGYAALWNGRTIAISTQGPNWFNSTADIRDREVALNANILVHEAAHAFDSLVMTDRQRERIMALWGYDDWNTGGDYGRMCAEAFAYAFPAAFATEPVASGASIGVWGTHSYDRLSRIVDIDRPGTEPPPEPPKEDVVEIPGVANVHPRSEWVDPAYPITGPTVEASAIDAAVIHYTAAPAIPSDIAGYLRAIQRDYVDNRGYSIGYRWAVDQTGHAWQCRAWNLKSAANRNHNHHTEPILCLVNGDDMASPMAVRTVRAIIAESQRRSGRTFKIVGHGDIGATSCPGAGLRAQIKAGVFTPRPTTPPPPPLPPIGDEMGLNDYFVVTFTSDASMGQFGAFLVGPGGPVHLDATMRDAYINAGAVPHKSDNAALYQSYRRQALGG